VLHAEHSFIVKSQQSEVPTDFNELEGAFRIHIYDNSQQI
jgi:hypothetical protein